MAQDGDQLSLRSRLVSNLPAFGHPPTVGHAGEQRRF